MNWAIDKLIKTNGSEPAKAGVASFGFWGALFSALFISLFLLGGCRKSASSETETADESDVLVQVGDSVLTMREVLVRIPSGLEEADSAALFHTIVDGWIHRLLLDDIAVANIDNLEEIDRLVADYRKKLIIAAYRKKLREQGNDRGISEKSVVDYYDQHPEEMVLQRPVIKGLYVKIPDDSKRLADVRRWMATATSDAIDNLERYGLTDAIEYSFFEDAWLDWEIPARQIPYRFDNPDEFVKNNVNFETSYGGMTYILHIKEYILSGEKMPYEVAKPVISERLEAMQGGRYEEQLIAGLYARAQREGRLKFINYKKNK